MLLSPLQRPNRPLLIAEIGGNHEGDFEIAKGLAKLGLESGADAVKFQLYSGKTLVSPVESPDRYSHFQKFELTREQHLEIARMVESGGADYLASVWELEMLEWIDPYLKYYKIGSGDLTAWPVIRKFAERGKPMILSTGLATFEEVAETVGYIRSINRCYAERNNLALLQCTSMYPIKRCDANLRVMTRYREAFDCLVGYSDHTTDSVALETAAALGADVLEFHFTDSREGKEFRDHKVSLTKDEVIGLRSRIEAVNQVMGTADKQPLDCEVDSGHVTSFRRAAYLAEDRPAGHRLAAEDFVFLRPKHGCDSRWAEELVGKVLKKDVSALSAIQPDDV